MNNEGTLQKYLEKEKYWSSNCYCPGKVQSQDSSRPIIFITAVLWAGVSRFHCDNIFFFFFSHGNQNICIIKEFCQSNTKGLAYNFKFVYSCLPVKRLFFLIHQTISHIKIICNYSMSLLRLHAEKFTRKMQIISFNAGQFVI